MSSTDLILLRTRSVHERDRAFAEQLRAASGFDVRLLVDERNLPDRSTDPDVISLNAETYRALGLFTPEDASWRCGDYGIYAAWRSCPDYAHFWVIEDDVRIGGDIAAFFRLCSQSPGDLLAAELEEAGRNHHWWSYALSRDATPYRCLFGLVRLSTEAVEACYRKRKEHSRKINRMALWPNDESLVATTIVNAGLRAVDFNDLSPGLYDDRSFSVIGDPIPFEALPGPPKLFHPVRLEAERDSTFRRRFDDSPMLPFKLRKAVVRRLNRLSNW